MKYTFNFKSRYKIVNIEPHNKVMRYIHFQDLGKECEMIHVYPESATIKVYYEDGTWSYLHTSWIENTIGNETTPTFIIVTHNTTYTLEKI